MEQIAVKRKKKGWKLFFCVLPGILLVLVFCYLPLWGWSFAFFQYKPGKAIFDCVFVGWRNFQKLVQTVTTLPNFISWVIMFSLALAIFGSNGLVNTSLHNMGIEATVNVLTTDKHVWLTQVLLQQWKGLGWSAIIYFAAIAGLDQELYEAAMVDGAGRWARIRYITIPQLIPTYFVLLIMSIGNFLNTGVHQYLTGDRRLGDIFEDVKDADRSMKNVAQCNDTDENGNVRTGVRSGPDGGTEDGNRTEPVGGIEAGGRIADGAGTALWDIPWITTNTTSQWCLNVMMCLEFIREYLPADLEACREPADKLK